jgi:hypothetical protein
MWGNAAAGTFDEVNSPDLVTFVDALFALHAHCILRFFATTIPLCEHDRTCTHCYVVFCCATGDLTV